MLYAAVHVWWAVAGEPEFTGRGESFFPGGWVPVVPALLAASVCWVIAMPGIRAGRLLIGAGTVAGLAMMAYCFLFWVGLAMLLMLPFGVPMSRDDFAVLLVRAAGVGGGFLTLWCCRTEFRRISAACDRCGRVHGRSPERRTESSPWWAYAGAYLTVAGLAARLVPAVQEWIATEAVAEGPGGVGFKIFVALLVLSGSLLPLALVHRWGRIWPAWVLPWAGNDVPRWVVLGPGIFMGLGLTLYFGLAGMTAMAMGRTPPDAALSIGGYTAWGVGLLIASASYYRLTKPPCSGAPVLVTHP